MTGQAASSHVPHYANDGTARCSGCGKVRFGSRKAAKRAARIGHPGEHMNQYRCGEFWHNGHVHPGVLIGAIRR